MSLRDAADQFERTIGIEAFAAIRPQTGAAFCIGNGFGVGILVLTRASGGMQEIDAFFFRLILRHESKQLRSVFSEGDAGSKTDAVTAAEVSRLNGRGVDNGDVICCGNGIDQLFGISVVRGYIYNRCFHIVFQPFFFKRSNSIMPTSRGRKSVSAVKMAGRRKKHPDETQQRMLCSLHCI